MNPKLTSTIKHYALGLFASSWNGGISAVAGILGIDAVAMTGADAAITGNQAARVLNAHEMVAAFCGAFIIHAFMWLKAHPLPETYNDTTPPIPK